MDTAVFQNDLSHKHTVRAALGPQARAASHSIIRAKEPKMPGHASVVFYESAECFDATEGYYKQ